MKAVIRQQVDVEFVLKFCAKKLFNHHEAQEGHEEWTVKLEKMAEDRQVILFHRALRDSVGDSRRIKHQRWETLH